MLRTGMRPSRAGGRARSAARRTPSRARTSASCRSLRLGATAGSTDRAAPSGSPSRKPLRARRAPSRRGSPVPSRRERRTRRYENERSIPATSRSGERLLAPALGERPRRLALEVDDDPVVAVPQRLAEVEVAVGADALSRPSPTAERRAASVARIASAAPDERRELLALGQTRRRRRRSPRRSCAVSRPALSGVGVLGRERRVRRVGREHRVHLADDRAELAASRSRNASGSTRSSRRAELPAVDARPGRTAARPERRVHRARPRTPYQPASFGDVRSKPCSAKNSSMSSSGFTPASTRRYAFTISSSPTTTDEFDCSTAERRAPSQRRASATGRRSPANLTRLVGRRATVDCVGAPIELDEASVAELAGAAGRSSTALAVVRRADEQLVQVVRPGVELHVDERDRRGSSTPSGTVVDHARRRAPRGCFAPNQRCSRRYWTRTSSSSTPARAEHGRRRQSSASSAGWNQ